MPITCLHIAVLLVDCTVLAQNALPSTESRDAAVADGAAVGPLEILPGDRMFKRSIKLKTANGLTEPTLHTNLFALDHGLVPPERRTRVVSWVIAYESQIRQIMANHYNSSCSNHWMNRVTIRSCWIGFVTNGKR